MVTITAVDIVLMTRLISDIIKQFKRVGVEVNLDELPQMLRDIKAEADAADAVMGITPKE